MKTIALIITLILTTQFSNAQDTTETHSISVSIDNVKSDTGKVVFSLHTAESFMKSGGVQRLQSEIKDGKATATFIDVTPGTYAIMTIHDENENNTMDFDASGMPTESYGMSNNPMSYGPPQFYEAKFELINEDLNFAIRF